MATVREYNDHAVSSGYHWVLHEYVGRKGTVKWMVANVSGQLAKQQNTWLQDALADER